MIIEWEELMLIIFSPSLINGFQTNQLFDIPEEILVNLFSPNEIL